jgi:hypothetical protein
VAFGKRVQADGPDVPTLSTSPDWLDRLRAVGSATIRVVAKIGLSFWIALLVGVGTSWYMVEAGSWLTTRRDGPWVTWTQAATPDADPYTRARFARDGSLPLSANIANTYEARTDDDGQRLHSSCEYVLDGNGLASGWWSLAVFDDRGRLIPNGAERYAYNSATIARGADGRFTVTLARDARPGNWLPTDGAGRMTLVLTWLNSSTDGAGSVPSTDAPRLPTVRRVGCR